MKHVEAKEKALAYSNLVYDEDTDAWYLLDAETGERRVAKITVEGIWLRDCRDDSVVSDLKTEDPEWFKVMKQMFER